MNGALRAAEEARNSVEYLALMAQGDDFWKLDHLSNPQLLESLGNVLRTKRRALAELVAHLSEVEERRLHLDAAYGSLFDYCVRHWDMSEDEACRRIELARLARQFPALFARVAAGEISLSVALLLKSVLTQDNHAELFDAACGKSVREARELLAAKYPRPDVASNIRKLPERRVRESTVGKARAPEGDAPKQLRSAPMAPDPSEPASSTTGVAVAEHLVKAESLPSFALAPPPSAHDRIEPLSAQRYKVQFTAAAALKEKIARARLDAPCAPGWRLCADGRARARLAHRRPATTPVRRRRAPHGHARGKSARFRTASRGDVL